MAGLAALFGNSKKDEKLTGLFAQSSGPVKRNAGQRTVLEVTKAESEDESVSESEDSEQGQEDEDEDEEDSDEEMEETTVEIKKNKKRNQNDEDDDLEGKYLEKILKDPTSKKSNKEEGEEKENTDTEGESDSDSEVTEESTKSAKSTEAKSIDFKEKEVEKAQRTIFIGNLTSSVVTSKKDYKELKKFFSTFGEIESIRFRSISFNEPIPRKAAFVKQKLHESRESLNAYIVFKSQQDARKALGANGTVLFDLHLRVDSVSHPAKIDNKRTIFVGNLDFEEKEEELWNIFGGCGEIDSVRIVRDSATNMGKGFGYVQFKDFTSVSKALLLHEKKLGAKKRKLRITRSKLRSKQDQGSNKNNNKNQPKQRALKNLTDDQKTKLGRAQRVLGKADRSQAGKVIEGQRAQKGDRVAGVKNGKNRVKKPRIRQRSTDFKKNRT